ncbi:glycosyltransferase family 2 protein [Synechocystis sp. FACHB-383]|uniref:glycosyltransferase family A protein n=1 Tax=Synechocystis sp. FACHB-383 TaxID=2692864 RepID=UPI001686A833|nr:glycosyltransferase family A protein [Synechocystis sp. FACHB-383]MBD2654454.1 glycosyltransferase family 2 protein [Synechocystis sp. FACHB-383]
MPHIMLTQLNYLVKTFPYRSALWYKIYIVIQAYDIFRGYLSIRKNLSSPPANNRFPEQKCVIILLSHNRYRNMNLIVRSALHNNFVSRLIVSNSNREVKIGDWIKVQDPRLELIDETQPTQPGHRFVLAKKENGDYFLSVDDDIFMTPRQWANFFDCLVENPEIPHGLTGNDYQPGQISSNGSPFHQVTEVNQNTDTLIGAFAFTRQHLERLFQLATFLNLPDLSLVRNGEDILLSFAGLGKPQIHDLGPIWTCASNGLPGVALWQTHLDFWDERIRLFEATQTVRIAMDEPWKEETSTHSLRHE